MKPLPQNWKDGPVYKKSQNWGSLGAQASLGKKLLRRTENIPPLEVIAVLPKRKRFKDGIWVDSTRDIKLLNLCLNPNFTMNDISSLLNKELSPTRFVFTKAVCQSRLNFLRLHWAKHQKNGGALGL